ncbi:MAG TPA: AFG1/ZapE family ATPase [Thermomicrobiaceae bacterium]|nr:AFG1/ZapE family ATPase [Thermomicrobiaceae bacterium]
MIERTIDELRQVVRSSRGPQFRLPKRFLGASFANYLPDPAHPGQQQAVEAIQRLIERPKQAPRRWWPRARRQPDTDPSDIYLDGPPGVGKTHLLAAAYLAASEPKLFATFDEFSAAAGTLGMPKLSRLLASQDLVCVDEIDLRDPANMMLLVSLLRAMLAGETRIIASANADPLRSSGSGVDQFRREVGEIAQTFEIIVVDGTDHRALANSASHEGADSGPPAEPRVLRVNWPQLQAFLYDVHPMYDAAWLDELDLIVLDRLEPLANTDQALRFVRFIDRVYDRDVQLSVTSGLIDPAELLTPLANDRRFQMHYARCRSRLTELLAANGGWEVACQAHE